VMAPKGLLAKAPAKRVMACLGMRYWGSTAKRSDTQVPFE